MINHRTCRSLVMAMACVSACMPTTSHSATSSIIEVETFTEPYRRIEVPAAEMGVLSELLVEEGDEVTQMQLLARVDDSVLKISLQVAKAARDADGVMNSAATELTLRQQQLHSYLELHQRGNASPREVERAEQSHVQALTRVETVREELEIRGLEYERILAQLKMREIRSPMNGVVVKIEKEAGEFVSPTDPVVLQIVELQRLKAVFSVPMAVAERLTKQQTVWMWVGRTSQRVPGVIELVSPITDAESGTVRVKIRIDNRDQKIPSGVICRWDMRSTPPELKTAQSNPSSPSRVGN